MTLEELARKIDDLHMQVMLLGRKKRRRTGGSGKPLGRPPTQVKKCMRTIAIEMQGLRRISARRLKDRLLREGHSASTINNARKRLGLQVVKEGDLWYWVKRHGREKY